MIELFLLTGLLLCGWQAIRSPRLLAAAIWLAGASALVALALYRLGAPEAAAIELSVGAGLVTILFVFAIATAGEDAMGATPVVRPWIAGALVIAGIALLAWMSLPITVANPAPGSTEASFTAVLWQERALDVLVQIGLIFAAVLGVLGLLAETDAVLRRGNQMVHDDREPAHERKHVGNNYVTE